MAVHGAGPAPGSGLPAPGFDPGRFDLVLAAADLGSFDWDIVDDRLDWDERLCRIVGLEPGESGGSISLLWDRVFLEDLTDVVEAVQAAIDQGGDFGCEFRILAPDGSLRWVDTRGRVYFGPDGKPLRLIAAARDCTLERADRSPSRQGRAQGRRPDDAALPVEGHDRRHGSRRAPTASSSIDRSDPLAVRHARHFISGVLADWGLAAEREAIVLLVSEVVTNALCYTDGEVDLTMRRLAGRLRVEVSDDTPSPPRSGGGELFDESGRGVPLLGGFSDRWGCSPCGQGKVVWFELDDL